MAMYSLFTNGDVKNLTVFVDGELLAVTNQHPRFDEILELVENDYTDGIQSLIDNSVAVAQKFEKVSDQVSIRGGEVLFEGDVVDDLIADHILRFYSENSEETFLPLVRFLEKLHSNPNPHSVEHLFRWLQQQDLTITPTGDFIAYKGVREDMRSWHAGDGIVDGVEFKQEHLLNNPGSLVEMQRSAVTFDPADGCSFGLHAGTWNYASGFAHTTLEVHINPRDVVSVPVDCSDQKLRCCRYRVIKVLDSAYDSAYVADTYSWDEDDEPEAEGFEFEVGEAYDYAGSTVVVREEGPDDDDKVVVSWDFNNPYTFVIEADELR